MTDANTSCLDMTNNLTSISDEMKGKQTFTQKIRNAESLNLKNSIFEFIRKMQISHLEERDIVMKTQQKILQIEKEFQNLHNETDSQIIQENYEVIERIITKALYVQLIKGCRVKYDRKIEFYCRVYDFLQPIHFQVDQVIVNHPNFLKAKQCKLSKCEILKQNIQMQNNRNPKYRLMPNTKRQDDMHCEWMQIDEQQSINNSQHLITYLLFKQKDAIATNAKNQPTGLDDLLPSTCKTTHKSIVHLVNQLPSYNINRIELRSDKYLLGEEYYFTLYSSVMELIENLQWADLKDISEKQYNESFKANYKKYSGFLDAVDKEEEEIKKQEIFKLVTSLQNQMKEFQERFKALDNNKLKFADKPYQTMSLGDLQEFYNEYHILHKHILDSQLDLQTQINFVDNFIDSKTDNPKISKQQSSSNNTPSEINNEQTQNNSKQQSSFFSFF